MNAHNSLLDNFSSMHDEFNSSNNRMNRSIDAIFDSEFKDLVDSLDYFNGEYLVIDKRELKDLMSKFREKLLNYKVAHMENYQKSFNKEVELLESEMCNFFEKKLVKGENAKKKMGFGVKKIVDKMCDLNIFGFEENLGNDIYNFKINFECKYIRDEYCKEDFNKVIRSFEHSLFEEVRGLVLNALTEKQEIVSRYARKAYDIIEGYRNKGVRRAS